MQQQSASLDCLKVGRQWAANYEIDVVGVDTHVRLNAIGECKWRNKEIGMPVYRELRDKGIKHDLPVTPQCK